ncbi:MAG: c-type cytochrome [Pseudomonadota bacterium]
MIKLFSLFIFFLVLTPFCMAQEEEKSRTAEEIVNSSCHLCHGQNGEGSSSIYPRLAGQHREYIAKQLMDFRSGRRKGTMNDMAKNLTNTEIFSLAEYFNNKPTLTHRVRNKGFAAVGEYIFLNGNEYSGIEACATCHGEKGAGTKALPRLAGQHKRYVSSQLEEFNSRKRTNDNAIMYSIASKLTELEREAVALYVSGLK